MVNGEGAGGPAGGTVVGEVAADGVPLGFGVGASGTLGACAATMLEAATLGAIEDDAVLLFWGGSDFTWGGLGRMGETVCGTAGGFPCVFPGEEFFL